MKLFNILYDLVTSFEKNVLYGPVGFFTEEASNSYILTFDNP